VVALHVPAGQPVLVAIDDTLFKRRGKKIWAASWFYDGSAQGPAKTGYANNWVVAAIVVKLPTIRRPVQPGSGLLAGWASEAAVTPVEPQDNTTCGYGKGRCLVNAYG
jgi:hypothetical protein